jgi:serine/threonine-protein kinase
VLGPRLGVGGMGEVYHALQLGMGEFAKPLALKLLLPHLALKEASVQRFLDEAKLASRLNHPNIVQLFDVGRVGQRYFIAMELVRGISLFRVVRSLAHQGQRLDEAMFLHVARSLCDGLSHAHALTDGKHAMGLIHGDLTPDNVLISIEGQVRLADFGIAQVRGSERKGPLVGKLGYVAPEQLGDAQVDHRADLFGLGVTLFQAYTGVTPFDLQNMDVYTDQVLNQSRPSVASYRPDASAVIARVIDRCLAADPHQRFDSAAAVKAALPTPPGNAGEELGELVKKLWGEERKVLEKAVLHTQQLKASTERIGPTPVLSDEIAAPAPKRWVVPMVLGIATVVTIVIAAGLAFSSSVSSPTKTVASAPATEPVTPENVSGVPFGQAAEVGDTETAPAGATPTEAKQAEPKAPASASDSKSFDTQAKTTRGDFRNESKHDGKTTRFKKRPVKAQTETAPPPKAMARVEPGILVIDARPWAKVVVNGVLIGETPIASYPTMAGAVTIELSNPETGRTVTRRVSVKPGESLTVREDLR